MSELHTSTYWDSTRGLINQPYIILYKDVAEKYNSKNESQWNYYTVLIKRVIILKKIFNSILQRSVHLPTSGADHEIKVETLKDY